MQPVNVSDSSSNANNVFLISISFATMSLVRVPDPTRGLTDRGLWRTELHLPGLK
jgi:hypothetical protein